MGEIDRMAEEAAEKIQALAEEAQAEMQKLVDPFWGASTDAIHERGGTRKE